VSADWLDDPHWLVRARVDAARVVQLTITVARPLEQIGARRGVASARIGGSQGHRAADREPGGDMKTHVHHVTVHWGDCDPAGIVFFPNFSKWMDESPLAFFRACGLPPWRELERTRGIVGTPLLEIHTRFVRPATYGDVLEVHTSVEHWSAKAFRHRHVIKRGHTVLNEGTEVRAFCRRDPSDPERIRAIPVPEDIKALCQ
jgi:4-hydroxybenzoyl-CoA thioesterase